MKFRRVILESPYKGTEPAQVQANVDYARLCMRDCLKRGDTPMASHALYTQPGVLNDDIPEERHIGIEAGLAWGPVAEATVVYSDRGISSGMALGIKRAHEEGRPVEYRTILPLPVTGPADRQPLMLGLPGITSAAHHSV